MLQRARHWFSFSRESGVVVAQYEELKRQLPFLYALLIINASAVAYTHYAYAPAWLTVGVTGVMVLACVWRILWWTLGAKPAAMIDGFRARALLSGVTLATVPICVAFLGWALTLDQYGGPFEHSHIAIFIAVTAIGCIFCLGPFPQAAIVVNVVVMVPFLTYCVMSGNSVLIATALNVVLVTGVMIRVLFNSFSSFNALILSQASLAAKQAEAQRLGEENASLALTDALTGLPNRRDFFLRLESLLRTGRADQGRFAVGLLDLDRFKPINDAYGHAVGDRVLIAVAHRIAARLPEIFVTRLGGDEFGLLISDDIDRLEAIGQQICDVMSEPFDLDDLRVSLGCSVGLAIFPDAGTTANQLFDRSDYALYNVKTTRRGGFAIFSADHETDIRSALELEAALQMADLDRELAIQFQPIICTESRKVVAVEALGRWTSPTAGAVEPDRFIAVAERLGLMHPITIKLFRIALTSFASIPAPIELSFNLSAQDIVSPTTIRPLVDAITEAGIDPRRITFELTETALMRNFEAAVAGINWLRSLGISIALDDFGIGYSSLSYLHRLPLDKVKVDRSFIANVNETSDDKIISAILGLCKTLELECIVEGIETESQLRRARDLGYRTAQGYLFARPMPLPALLAWLEPKSATPDRKKAPRERCAPLPPPPPARRGIKPVAAKMH